MTASPKVPNITLDPSPRVICVEFYGREPARRKALRHPPSSNMRGGRRTNIWKRSDEETDAHDDETNLGRPTCKVKG
jgi:hypothetical protein